MAAYLSLQGLLAVLVLMFAAWQMLMAYWPEWRGWPDTVPSRSARLRNPVVPIEWAFAIWGPIFIACLAFGVWQALPGQLDDGLLKRIRTMALLLFAGNVAWQIYVPKRDLDGVSVAIIVVELALALAILFTVAFDASAQSGLQFWLVFAPFQLLTGWVSAAVFVNAASALQRSGVAIGRRLGLALVGAASALGAAVAAATGGWIYAAAVAWALMGVAIANIRRPDAQRPVALAAMLLLPLPLVAAAAALR